tara:strand:- start:7452 stop:8114 length:663 start_codon:yes stop_codon:yes gene_type:complete
MQIMNDLNKFKQAIILNVHYTGANMALVTIFCEHKGLQKGIVKIAKKRQAELQKGNIIEYIHLKRKEDNLGTLKFNLIEQTFVKYFDNLNAMKNLNYICKNLVKYLKEDIPYTNLFISTTKLFDTLGLQNEELMALYDYNLLKELGVTLDAANYLKEDDDNSPAYYISPKSGRVVSKQMGDPYKSKLLVLPQILGGIENAEQTKLVQQINKFLFNKLFNG